MQVYHLTISLHAYWTMPNINALSRIDSLKWGVYRSKKSEFILLILNAVLNFVLKPINIQTMKKFIIFTLALFFMGSTFGQVFPNKYYIQFTDKNNSPYSINNPLEYLSQRARTRWVSAP